MNKEQFCSEWQESYEFMTIDVVPLQCYDASQHGARCRDTYGYFSRPEFARWTCSKCFFHIFDVISDENGAVSRPPLVYDTSLTAGTLLYEQADENGTLQVVDVYEPDALHNDSLVCRKFLSADKCARWRSCCQAALQCCDRQLDMWTGNSSNRQSSMSKMCNMTWDGFACWNATQPDTIAQQMCPEYYQSGGTFHTSNLLATKWCTNDGWYNRSYANTAPLEWTNHSLCVDDESVAKSILLATSTLSVFLHSVSIAVLLLCMFVIIVCRNIGSDITRLMLKVHFMLFFAFGCLHTTLLIYESVFYQPALRTRQDMSASLVTCKVVNAMIWYFRGATYFSLLCEVFYLLRRMLIRSNLESFVVYLLVASLVPLLPVALLVFIRLLFFPTEWCRMDDALTLIVYVPNIFVLFVNLVVLIVVHHRVISSYHAAKRYLPNVAIVKRGVKLAGLLLPVFGVQNFVIIYRPQYWIYYELIEAIVIGTQGTIIAIVYCGLNNEIRKELVRVFRRFQRYRQSASLSNGGAAMRLARSEVSHVRASKTSIGISRETRPNDSSSDSNQNNLTLGQTITTVLPDSQKSLVDCANSASDFLDLSVDHVTR